MYFLAQNNEKTGPFTLEQLREMWRAGAVYPQTLYWQDGMAEWQPLSRLDSSLLNLGLSTPAVFPVSPAAPGGPHSLIAPTTLPPAVPGPPTPAPPEMPPAAYLSLTFALVGPFLMLFGHGVGFFPGAALCIAAIVCGHTARAAIRGSGNRLPGEGIATAGLILGYGCVGMCLVMVLLAVAGLIFAFGITQQMAHH